MPIHILTEFLDDACEHDGGARILSKRAYRAAKLRGRIGAFCDAVACHYQSSRRHHVEGDMTFRRFVTVIRQLCRLHCLPCESSVLYSGSQYEMKYRISTRRD